MKSCKYLFFIVISFLFLISCRAKRQEIEKKHTEVYQNTEHYVNYKDTTLYTPSAETSVSIPLNNLGFKNDLKQDLKPFKYQQKNGHAKLKIKIVHDTIQATAECDSLALVAKIKQQIFKETKNLTDNNSKIEKIKTGYSIFELIIAFVSGLIIGYLIKFFT